MCGIAGIFHLETAKPVEPARVERMCDAIAHRGPDGHGVWSEPGVCLGHRRLSIIDVAGSPQPMASSDGRVMLVFNGEIYNYRELRRELAAEGAQFHTDGDSEVILAAWQRWGVDCLQRLHGMFAFAIYDLAERTLLLARDRLGVKPLFYAPLADGSVIFGSELKALLAHPSLRREVDPLAVEDFLAWGYVPDESSLVKGVRKLGAGHFLLLKRGAGLPAERQWWDVSFADRRRGKVADLEAELVHLLREAVTSRMVADVPLGAFLSGGVDSSSVVALMAEASASPVKTCSIGFDVVALDESSHAAAVADRFATDHRARRVSPDDFAEIDALAAMFDEPFADASALPTWRVCQLARETVTVALSGDGADEAFAGYRRHVFQRAEDRVRLILPAALRGPVFGTLGAIYPKADWAPRPLRAKSTLLGLAGDGVAGYARSLGVLTPELRDGVYSDAFHRLRGDYRAEQRMIDLMDNALARSALEDVGFKRVIEAGLGGGPVDFLGLRTHAFPGPRSAKRMWGIGSESQGVNLDLPAYRSLGKGGLDRCGLTQLAGRTVGAPFVGAVAACLVIGDVLRTLHGGRQFDLIDTHLREIEHRTILPADHTEPFNPGSTPAHLF